jgi:hypothetical protein
MFSALPVRTATPMIPIMKNVTPSADHLPAVPDKPRRISAKVRTAIDALVAGEAVTVTAAAEKAGLSREHLSRELSKPHVAEHLSQRVRRNLAVASARAGAVKTMLLDSPNELVRDRASSFVLGLAGIKPDVTPPVQPGRSPGVVIQIISQSAAPAIVIDHEPIIPTPSL